MDALQSHRYDYQPVGLAHHQKHLTRRSVSPRASSRSPQRYKFLGLTMSNLGIPRFEESFIQNLAAHQATAMLRRGLDTILVHSTSNASGTQVLNIIGCVRSKGGGLFPGDARYSDSFNNRDLNSVRRSVRNVTFSTGQRTYTRASIETMQLLHYKVVSLDYLHGTISDLGDAHYESYLDNAELLVFYAEKESRTNGDVSRTSIRCSHPDLHCSRRPSNHLAPRYS